MLRLVWSTDAAIKDAVVQAYRRLYLNPQGDNTRAKAQTLVDSLSELMVDASLGTIQCLEEIVQEFFWWWQQPAVHGGAGSVGEVHWQTRDLQPAQTSSSTASGNGCTSREGGGPQ
uniref:Uncharacterized protein n=1 Tax=Hucho hucho TaxID=62062 RepID=A0A4W5PTR2_9TELE